MNDRPGLTETETQIIDYIEEGWARWKIAEMVGLGDTTVRGIIKRLCERFNCSMRDLPEVVRDYDGKEQS